MVTHVVTTDSSCLRMIPPFVRTGRVKGWSIAGTTMVDGRVIHATNLLNVSTLKLLK
jgi:hypothetical protein